MKLSGVIGIIGKAGFLSGRGVVIHPGEEHKDVDSKQQQTTLLVK